MPNSSHARVVERLRCFRGIDTLTAAGLGAEVGDFRRFAKPALLSGFLGVVPSEYTSDDKRVQGQITKAGPANARRLLCLPVLFAAGMSLLDTIDGSFMNFAYGWAFSKPVRKVYYNITITALSVVVALVVGTIELLGLAASKLTLHGGFWDWVATVNINTLGYWS